MNILHYSGMCSTKMGGLESFFLALFNASKRKDIDCSIVYDTIPANRVYVRELENSGADLLIADSRCNFLRQTLEFISILRTTHPDIVHFHFSKNIGILSFVSKLFGVKYVLRTNHCCVYQHGRHPMSPKELGYKSRIKKIFDFSYLFVDRTLCVSDFVKRQWLALYPKAKGVEVARLGVPPPTSYSEKEKKKNRYNISISDDFVISSVVFANPIKGADILIKAVSLCDFNMKLILIGLDEDDVYTKYLHVLATELRLNEKICWIGISDNVSQYLAISDVYIQPSRSEAMGLAAIEAASYSLPIIGANVGGLPEISSLTFEPGNFEELASLISKIHSSRVVHRDLGDQSYKKWETLFQLSYSADNYLKIYSSL